MLGTYCSFRNQLYKLLGRYVYCLICQVGLPKGGPNFYEIASRLMDGEISPIENPTLDELLLQGIRINQESGRCSPRTNGWCIGLGGLAGNANFIYYFLGEYAYRLLYGLGDKKLDCKLSKIFNGRCPSKNRFELDELLLRALSNK